MSFVIGADIVPTESNLDLFVSGDAEQLVGKEMISFLAEQDYRIFNLETPLCDSVSPIAKFGPNLCTPTAAIKSLKKLNIDAVTIANNHILDQGKTGLTSTIDILFKNGISHFGAGETTEKASSTLFFHHGKETVGVYGCCAKEFCSLEGEQCTANVFSPYTSLEQIQLAKNHCSFLVVLYHGGKELYRYPSPNLQNACHAIVRAGADLVVCQHSHCVGCREQYQHATIIYGQGNFIFDAEDDEYWNNGLLIKVTDQYEIEYIPYMKRNGKITLANASEGEQIIKGFESRSREISNGSFVEDNFRNYCSIIRNSYLPMLLGVGKKPFFRILNRITNQRWAKIYVDRKLNSNNRFMIMNMIQCEAHREIVLKLLAYEKEKFAGK